MVMLEEEEERLLEWNMEEFKHTYIYSLIIIFDNQVVLCYIQIYIQSLIKNKMR